MDNFLPNTYTAMHPSVVTAYDQAKKIISSCNSKPQLDVAENYIDNFAKMYSNQTALIEDLRILYSDKFNFIVIE